MGDLDVSVTGNTNGFTVGTDNTSTLNLPFVFLLSTEN